MFHKPCGLILIVVFLSGCANLSPHPSGYFHWDKRLDISQPEEFDGTVEGLINEIYPKWKYRKDTTEQWDIPTLDEAGKYRGDCEDYALLVAAHLKARGVPTRLAAGYRQYAAFYTGEIITVRHALLVLPDGRYVDNLHKKPFTRHPYEIYWTSPPL